MLLADAEAYLSQMRAGADTANVVLRRMPNGGRANSVEKLEYQSAEADRDRIVLERDNTSRLVDALRAQQIPAGRKERAREGLQGEVGGLSKATDELTPLIDKALAEYRKLHDDPSVNEALADFRRKTKASARLGAVEKSSESGRFDQGSQAHVLARDSRTEEENAHSKRALHGRTQEEGAGGEA